MLALAMQMLVTSWSMLGELPAPKDVVTPSFEQRFLDATSLYRAGHFAAACTAYQALATERPDDGAVQADLGLCRLKTNERPASIAASLKAAHLGDAPVRRSAYFNLKLAGHVLTHERRPDDDVRDTACGWLVTPRRARAAKLWVCVFQGDTGSGSGVFMTGGEVSFSRRPPQPAPATTTPAIAAPITCSWLNQGRAFISEEGELVGGASGDAGSCELVAVDVDSNRAGWVCQNTTGVQVERREPAFALETALLSTAGDAASLSCREGPPKP